MLLTWAVLNVCHPNTAQCAKGAEQKQPRLSAEEIRASTKGTFQAYGPPLTLMSSFKYLGQILIASDNNWPGVVGNLSNFQKKWDSLSRILGREAVKTVGVRDVFQDGGSGRVSIWIRDVCDDPPCEPGPGGVLAQGGKSDHR